MARERSIEGPFWIAPHLAFLVQWLRVLGMDVRLWTGTEKSGPAGDRVVQWSRYPLALHGAEVLTLSSSIREDLLKEFFSSLGIEPDRTRMFTRCLGCNSRLSPMTPEEVFRLWPEIPPYVYQTQPRFNWCPGCKKFYWAGTHVRNMIRTLEEWGVIPRNPPETL